MTHGTGLLWPLILAVGVTWPTVAAASVYIVDTTSAGSALTADACLSGTIDGVPIGLPDALADDGALSIREAICLANHDGEDALITLPAGAEIVFSDVDKTWYGPNALPPVFSTVTITGEGTTLRRDPAAPSFRFFYVAGPFHALGAPAGATATPGDLTLVGLELRDGCSVPSR